MKKLRIFLFLLLMYPFMGCSSEGAKDEVIPPAGSQSEKEYINLSTYVVDKDASGGSVQITLSTNVSWVAKSDSDWCVVTPSAGNAGTVTLKVMLDENVSCDEDRSALVTIKGVALSRSVKIVQARRYVLDVSADSLCVRNCNDTLSFNVSGNIPYTVKIDPDWIKEENVVQLKGVAEYRHKFMVYMNEASEERVGLITVENKERQIKKVVTVLQKGTPPDNTQNPEGKIEDMIWN